MDFVPAYVTARLKKSSLFSEKKKQFQNVPILSVALVFIKFFDNYGFHLLKLILCLIDRKPQILHTELNCCYVAKTTLSTHNCVPKLCAIFILQGVPKILLFDKESSNGLYFIV